MSERKVDKTAPAAPKQLTPEELKAVGGGARTTDPANPRAKSTAAGFFDEADSLFGK